MLTADWKQLTPEELTCPSVRKQIMEAYLDGTLSGEEVFQFAIKVMEYERLLEERTKVSRKQR